MLLVFDVIKCKQFTNMFLGVADGDVISFSEAKPRIFRRHGERVHQRFAAGCRRGNGPLCAGNVSVHVSIYMFRPRGVPAAALPGACVFCRSGLPDPGRAAVATKHARFSCSLMFPY